MIHNQLVQYKEELKQRAKTLNSGDILPKKKVLRLPNKIKLENKLKKASPSPEEAENRLHLLINKVSPPNRTMTAF